MIPPAPRPVPEVDPGRLAGGAETLGVQLAPRQVRLLVDFAELLERWNRAFNLISRRDVARLLPRHLLDSLSVVPLLGAGRVMDLGTGAGLPGVPLAIARPDVQFTLVDRSSRKIRFVQRAVRTLELGNVLAWCGDVRERPAGERFDAVVCRAVAELDLAWALAAPRLRRGGRLLVMHRGQGADAGPVAPPPGARIVDQHQLRIPGLERPHGIVVLGRHDEADDGRHDNLRSAP